MFQEVNFGSSENYSSIALLIYCWHKCEAHGKLGARCAADLSKRLPFTGIYNFVHGVHASLI